jgi:hypothetical protein
MSLGNKLTEFCKSHINKLEKRLSEIYTTIPPEEYAKHVGLNNNIEINILEELKKLEAIENIYAVLEKEGVHDGEVYNEYNGYLHNVRNAIKVLKTVIDDIERENASDIKNIQVLIDTFKKELSKMNNN